jgi:hypothetical protein
MKTIEQLLIEVGEDKHQNLTTTSFKFKTDLWNFFQGFGDKVAIEFGTHKGQTTRIMSFLFDKVHTVNNTDNEKSKELNADRANIVHHNFNLYSSDTLPVTDTIDVALIDAGHTYAEVIYDINRVISMNCSKECYIVFDHAISQGYLEKVQEIGHSTGHNFGNGTKGGPDRILEASEGLITKVIWHG